MTEMTMPQGAGGGEHGLGGCWDCRGDGVAFASTIAAKNHASRPEFLDKKTKSVKFD
jgi:hypothetical protein